jgi:hypothetical protein
MSRSYALIGPTTFAGVRVDGFTTYIPAYIKGDGKRVSAQCIVNCYANTRARGGQAEGKRMRFQFSAWGKLANSVAFVAHKGMALDIIAEPEAYKARVWVTNAAGQRVPQLDAAGAEIKEWTTAFKIIDIHYAEEAADFIAKEIVEGRRPQFWNVPGHQHYDAWARALTERKGIVRPPFQAGMQYYGHAKVFVPQGVTLDFTDPNAQNGANTQAQVAAATGYVDPNAALAGTVPTAAVHPTAPVNGMATANGQPPVNQYNAHLYHV